MEEALSTLLTTLREARTFEAGAVRLLKPVLAEACAALAERPKGDARAAILRGMIHLRPGGAYRGLVAVDAHTGEQVPAEDEVSLVPSATAWRWIQRHKCPVAIDVEMASIKPLFSPEAASEFEMVPPEFDDKFDQQGTIFQLLGRRVTHLLVLPLLAVDGSISGMLSVEARSRVDIGRDFIWPTIGQRLSLMTEVGGLFLASLPLAPVGGIVSDDFLPVVGHSMGNLIRLLGVFAQQDETILLSGPTGTGKSRLARWCHERSGRQGKPFEAVDLTTIPKELQLPHLFGWRKGAFSGAVADNDGHVTCARGGTLFIDEIDKLSLEAQAGLLTLLENRTYRVLGEQLDREADVRFIVGTNTNLQEALAEGRLREDLYYRINVLPMALPPLSERADEVPRWANYMLQRRCASASSKNARPAVLAASANLALEGHEWPGNLRQLDNVIRRAYVLAMADEPAMKGVLHVEARHIEAAMFHGSDANLRSLSSLMGNAAHAFVREVVQHDNLSLDDASVFRAFVLLAAFRYSDKNMSEAFNLLGCQNLVKNRNHNRAFRQQINRLTLFLHRVEHEVDPEVLEILEEAGGPITEPPTN